MMLLRPKKNLPPGPFALPILGHLHLLKKPLHQTLQTLSAKYGPVLFLKFGTCPVLVVSSPDAMEQCFGSNDLTLANRPQCLSADYLTYNYTAVFWSPYCPSWRWQRRLIYTEILSWKSIQQSSPTRMEEVGCLVRGLFNVVVSSSSKSKHGRPEKVAVDLRFVLSSLTNNMMLRMAVGHRLVEEQHAYTDVEKQAYLELRKSVYPGLGMNICDYLPLLRHLGYRGMEKAFQRTHRVRDQYVQNLVDQVRSRRIHSPPLNCTGSHDQELRKGSPSLVDTFLSKQESEPDFYSDEVIKTILIMMLVAGTGVPTFTLEWAMSLLLNHPEAMRKLKAEIDNQVGHERLINESDLPKLPYLKCVLNEALRLYPTLPLMNPHFSSEPFTVGGYDIPAGTVVMANLWALHRNPTVWEDPDEFKPERFEEAALDGHKCSKFAPFGMGRRSCAGALMGMTMTSLPLGALIQCFDWERIGIEKEDMECGAIGGAALRKEKPLHALCTPRQHLTLLLSHV
ncbi:hypothetical protein Tsubulata_014453 [Turnera subulata]|uniref:Uncharacterized protein n=1 Tax=Turnera subulata TaxID=218843 RepID=A0A9Q0JMS3_9ROSI|nr:hypothetical protein Tsubulata_014453 [Turnera subulata]